MNQHKDFRSAYKAKYGGAAQSNGDFAQPSKHYTNQFAAIPESTTSAWAGPTAAERELSATLASQTSFTPMSYSMIDRDEQSIVGRGFIISNDVTLEGRNTSNISWQLAPEDISLFNSSKSSRPAFVPDGKPPSPISKANPTDPRRCAKSCPVNDSREISTLEDLLKRVQAMANDIPICELARRLMTPLDNSRSPNASYKEQKQTRRTLLPADTIPKIGDEDISWLLNPEEVTLFDSNSSRRSAKENVPRRCNAHEPPSSNVSRNYSKNERNVANDSRKNRSPCNDSTLPDVEARDISWQLAPEDSAGYRTLKSRTPSPRTQTCNLHQRSLHDTSGKEDLLKRSSPREIADNILNHSDRVATEERLARHSKVDVPSTRAILALIDNMPQDVSSYSMVDQIFPPPDGVPTKERLARHSKRVDVPSTRAIRALIDKMPRDMSPCTMVDQILALPASTQYNSASAHERGRRSVQATVSERQYKSECRPFSGRASCNDVDNTPRSQKSPCTGTHESPALAAHHKLMLEQAARREQHFEKKRMERAHQQW